MEEEKKRKWFAPRHDKSDAVAEDTTPTLAFFFKLLWRKFGKLTSLNLLMLFQIIPLVASLLIYLFGPVTSMADSALYAPLFGVSVIGKSPTAGLLFGIYARQLTAPILSPGRIWAIVILIGLTVLTWGWQNVGAVYNLRSLVRGDSCFLFSDFFYAIRKNLKQGFFFGLLDAFIIFLFIFNIYHFNTVETSTFFMSVVYFLNIVLIFLYIIMRFYLYLMLVTFDLSVRKLFKNALIFAVLGSKRNFVALVGIFLLLVIHLVIIIPSISIGFVIPMILPAFYLLPLIGFIGTYAAYPNIKRYMIDPVQSAEPNPPTTD